jgi:Fic family protein
VFQSTWNDDSITLQVDDNHVSHEKEHRPLIYQPPACGAEKKAALARIDQTWRELRPYVGDTRRWVGSVRRVLAARANQSSNSIEGYNVSTEDAIAVLQGAPEPTDSQWEDWQANLGYKRAMTYVLQLARDEHFRYSASMLQSLHFMITEYSLDAGPGLLRPGPVWVRNSTSGDVVYEAPESGYVPSLLDQLVEDLNENTDVPPLVRAAMAHLNLVLIHPFKDGNGRMARCLQSLVLVREGLLGRELCSIEEFLGQPANQQRYYDKLTEVARGQWTPENSSRPWVRFCLEAHYIQAQSVLRRIRESEWAWAEIIEIVEDNKLPMRTSEALFDATVGLRVRNASYRATLAEYEDGISSQTATNDLRELVKAKLLEQRGSKRGTFYVAGKDLEALRARLRQDRKPITANGLFEPLPAIPPSGSITEPEPPPGLFPSAALE